MSPRTTRKLPVGRRALHFDGDRWWVRMRMQMSEMELVAVLATHAARFGDPSLQLAPADVPDRIRAFLLTYGREAVQDTLTLPEWAVGWGRRQLSGYWDWVQEEDARALTGRPTRTTRVRRLPEE